LPELEAAKEIMDKMVEEAMLVILVHRESRVHLVSPGTGGQRGSLVQPELLVCGEAGVILVLLDRGVSKDLLDNLVHEDRLALLDHLVQLVRLV
jgi:hypothetical protein